MQCHMSHDINKNIAIEMKLLIGSLVRKSPKNNHEFFGSIFFPTYQPLKPEKYIDHGFATLLLMLIGVVPFFEGEGRFFI